MAETSTRKDQKKRGVSWTWPLPYGGGLVYSAASVQCTGTSSNQTLVLLHLEGLADPDDGVQSTAVVAQHTLPSQQRDLPPADVNLGITQKHFRSERGGRRPTRDTSLSQSHIHQSVKAGKYRLLWANLLAQDTWDSIPMVPPKSNMTRHPSC